MKKKGTLQDLKSDILSILLLLSAQQKLIDEILLSQ